MNDETRGEAQICPAIRNLAVAADRAMAPAETPRSISTGACPPSSIRTGFMPSAPRRVSAFPTEREPVKVTILITGDRISRSDTSLGLPKTTLSAFFGTPASMKHCANRQAALGVSSAGLMMTEQPAAIAPLSLHNGELIGTFHGVKAATGPMGSPKNEFLHGRIRGNDSPVRPLQLLGVPVEK